MPADPSLVVPRPIAVGLALGAAFTVGVAVLFLVAQRRFPDRSRPRSDGGQSRRRDEIREYLDAIDERYAEDHPVAGRSVAFYLPRQDVAITFDAEAYFHIDRTDTRPVLIEHELPGRHLGPRLPFDTPTVDLGDGDAEADAQRRVDDAFHRLGLPPGATAEEVREAYRDRVKRVHPDHGGDEEEFRRVREAYVTACEYVRSG